MWRHGQFSYLFCCCHSVLSPLARQLAFAYICTNVILIRRGPEPLSRLRTVYPHPSDSPCSTATQTTNVNHENRC